MDALKSLTDYAADPRTVFFLAAAIGYVLYKNTVKKTRPQNSVIDKDLSIYSDEDADFKLVLVIRTDLKMGKGKVAAQCAHAAVGAYKLSQRQPKLLEAWENCGQKKITVKVDSESELLEVARNARSVGILTNVIRDAGRTQVDPGSKTVCGIGPGPSDLIDEVTGHLKLY
ncbi:peptidyl-tRNA hydrolase 2, mitochondrial [Orussus abietinus]|uniref:peptidyl-tRNA hydrolase 2, mitochondrial n=1 Tax=Orussus abietinus TaxID=222816 RepID=UPI000625BDC4|nr:peptidyl-tRNA hydrolase 2, mitochondrial [Orussus abietinus]